MRELLEPKQQCALQAFLPNRTYDALHTQCRSAKLRVRLNVLHAYLDWLIGRKVLT
jgi:hypothetical protein